MKYLLILALVAPNIAKTATFKQKTFFYGKVWPWVKKAECGRCRPICHYDKKDPGGFTCIGMSIRSNADFYGKYLWDLYNNCSIRPVGNGVYCKNTKLFELTIKKHYYDKYASKFIENCPKKTALYLVDAAILEGVKRATLYMQKPFTNLKNDGIMGRKTLAACKKLKPRLVLKARKKRLKNLNPRYAKGWLKRLRNLEKYAKKNIKD